MMDALRRIVDAIAADVRRNPAWYAVVGTGIAYAVGMTAREYDRLRTMARDVTADLESRADEIAERMTIARQAEQDARYDLRYWGEGDK